MTIIVTGASRGIGFAILKKFAAAGWNLAFCSKDSASVSKAKTELAAINPSIKILAETVDVSLKNEVENFGKKCLDIFNNIDILVNNAGMYTPGMISGASYDDELEKLMQVNLYSAYWLGKIIIPNMVMNKSGHIFNISSIAGLQAYPNGGAYSITKFALTGYTKALREELKSSRIRVTGVYPGAVLTDSWAGVDLPKTRFIDPNDIAELIYTTHQLSPNATVEDIIIRPTDGDI
jgi:NADP-dependent 3-hydroxy acid dehydrogenase YdfG